MGESGVIALKGSGFLRNFVLPLMVGGPLFIFLYGCKSETDKHMIRLEEGFIGSGHFAFSESSSSGSSLFLGPVDGDVSLVIESSGRLQGPHIVSSSRLLLAEQIVPAKPGFRLLEINIDGSHVSCRRLVESQFYMGSPMVLKGPRADGILFLSGTYDEEATGGSVYNFHLTHLQTSEVMVLPGDSFLTIAGLSQVSESQFLATSAKIWDEIESDDQRAAGVVRNRLVDISIDGGRVNADYSDEFGSPDRELGVIALFPKAGIAFEAFYDFPEGGRQEYISRFDASGGEPLETIMLPRDRNFGLPFAEAVDDGRAIVRLLSVNRESEGRDGVVFMSELSGTKLINEHRIKLEPTTRFDTTNCSSAEVIF